MRGFLRISKGILLGDNSDLSRSNRAFFEAVANLGAHFDVADWVFGLENRKFEEEFKGKTYRGSRDLENCFMKIWIELLASWIDRDESMLRKRLRQNRPGHRDAFEQVLQWFAASFQFFRLDGLDGDVEDVWDLKNRIFKNKWKFFDSKANLKKILAEWLNCEDLGVFGLLHATTAHIFRFSERSLIFVLKIRGIWWKFLFFTLNSALSVCKSSYSFRRTSNAGLGTWDLSSPEIEDTTSSSYSAPAQSWFFSVK